MDLCWLMDSGDTVIVMKSVNQTRKWSQPRISYWEDSSWVGHVMRLKQERVPNTALKGYIEGRRPIEGSEGDVWRQWTGMLRGC